MASSARMSSYPKRSNFVSIRISEVTMSVHRWNLGSDNVCAPLSAVLKASETVGRLKVSAVSSQKSRKGAGIHIDFIGNSTFKLIQVGEELLFCGKMMKEGRESTPSPRRAICCNRQQRVMILALLILKSSMQVTFGFVGPINVGKGARSWSKTTSLYDIEPDTEEDSLTASTSAIWNWNAANSSLGSLLLQLQKEEEEEMKRAVGQSPNSTAFKITTTTSYDAPPPPPSPSAPQNELVAMDLETARELDDAVKKGIKTELLSGIEVLPTSSLYSTLTKRKRKLSTKMSSASRTRLFRPMKREQREFDAEILTMPLSMPEHYDERITRDMRHLAVSISSNVDEVWQWRLFCKQKGGIVPLLKCIQEGARFIREHINERGSKEFEFTEFAADQHEETFMAACTACRALRDLCAISPELSAVITDGILRSNDLWETGPLSDFVTLLQHTEVEIKREARDFFSLDRRNRRDARRRCKLYVLQLLEAMSDASDDAIHSIRSTPGLADAVLASSSYARIEKTRRWLRYPGKLIKMWSRRDSRNDDGAVEDIAGRSRPFIEAAALPSDLRGQVQEKANLVLAAIGYNAWVPKIPGQKGLRILCMDGGGTRGMAAVTTLRCLVEGMGGVEACEAFDMIAGTSTGAIIAFLVGLRKETSGKAKERYDALIKRIFVKSAWSSPLMLFTTATYDEQPFMEILSEILGDKTMLDSRADPTVPRVFAVASKMSSTPTHVCLFRNYNYASGELPDPFTVDPDAARRELELPVELDGELAKSYARTRRTTYEDKPYITGTKLSPDASRYPGETLLSV